ncbi:hypothetical protein FS837_012320 [Tulasnella sp. UAMH 9824]|nr:hypothetical protein FS837_012320 [Tulasnella sp. UAMH 9824]
MEPAQPELEDQARKGRSFLITPYYALELTAKLSPTNDLVKKPQVELTAARQAIVADESHVVELEMGNDNLARKLRAAKESSKELESQLNRTMENEILLEGKVGERKTLSEENHRLGMRTLGRSLTTRNLPDARGLSSPCGDKLSPISNAESSPVVPRYLELKDVPPSPTAPTLASSTSSRLPQRQSGLKHRLSFPTAIPPPQPSSSMASVTRQGRDRSGTAKIRPRLNSFTRAVTTSTSSSEPTAHITSSVLGFGGKENQGQPPQQQPPRPRQSVDSTRSAGSSASFNSPGWVVVQTEEEEEENKAVDTRKTPRAPRVKDVFTPTPIQSRARAILRPRRSDSDTSRPEITPLRFRGFGLGMRRGSTTSGRSSLSSASEAESGVERFGSLEKAARLSFAFESDSDLDAILKIRDSTDTVKATPKPKPRRSVPARTLSREDSSISMPPPSFRMDTIQGLGILRIQSKQRQRPSRVTRSSPEHRRKTIQ